MADNQETFKIDLDAKEFIKGAKEAQNAIKELGDVESLKGLLHYAGQATLALGAVAAAAYGVKTVLDLTIEAEHIKRVNAQFEMLAETAGIAGGTLKEGLEKAAGGLIDTDELLGSANKALVTLGSSAKDLPALFEVAKNATLVFGGTLTNNFESLNQAIASGNTRAIRHMGLIIDSEDAYRKYANTLGVTVSALDDSEKKQALLNAVLEKSRSTFKGNLTDTQDATFSIQRFNVAIKELKDTIILAFDRTIGPSIRALMGTLAEYAQAASKTIAGHFGSAEEQTEYQIKQTEIKIKALTDRLSKMEQPPETLLDRFFMLSPQGQERIKAQIDAYQSELARLKEEQARLISEKPTAPETAKTPEIDEGAQARRLESAAKFEMSLQDLRLQRIRSEEETATTIEQVNALNQEKIIALTELRDARLQELDAQRALQTIATDEELALKKEEITAKSNAEIVRLQQETDDRRIESLRRFAEYNRHTMAGFTGSMRAASAQAASDFSNFSKLGQQATTAFSTNAVRGFKAIGDGSKSAADAMAGMMLGAVADMAEAKGTELLLSGLWPPNPLALGAGGALVALSSFLRSKAGGASAGLGAQAATSATYGTETVPSGLAAGALAAAPTIPETRKREVSINIMGHYFETPDTRRMLVDMIRQESDATQFTINQIGQGA